MSYDIWSFAKHEGLNMQHKIETDAVTRTNIIKVYLDLTNYPIDCLLRAWEYGLGRYLFNRVRKASKQRS